MLIERSHHKWAIACLGLIVVAVVAYVFWRRTSPVRPVGNTTLGLTFGISAFAIMLFQGMLGIRKSLPAWQIGRLQTWMMAHLWLGLLTIGLVCLHTGLRRGGVLTTIMLVIFTVVAGSGMLGTFLQYFIPRMMTSEVPLETVYEQVERVREQLVGEADALVEEARGKETPQPKGTAVAAGSGEPVAAQSTTATQTPDAPEPLVIFYKAELRPFLVQNRRGKPRLSQAPAAEAVFRQLKTLLAPALHPIVDDLENICDEKRQLDRQRSLHHWLHGWMLVHGPLSLALLVIIAAHAFMALRY